jgi:hypothetical protein
MKSHIWPPWNGPSPSGLNFLPHPVSMGAGLGEMEEIAHLGFYAEIACLHILLQVVKISEALEVVRKVGERQRLLAKDAFFTWTPPSPEMLRFPAGPLHPYGVEAKALRQTVYENPRELLGGRRRQIR